MRGIVFFDRTIGYRSLPKTASTSIKAWIYKLEEGKVFCREEVGEHVHLYMNRTRCGKLAKCRYRFIVVRDPVKRFLSAYKNRVLYHQELSEQFIRKNFMEQYWDVPHFTPGLGQFVEHFEFYYQFEPVFHHCRPVVDFLADPHLNDFTHVYKLEDLPRLAQQLSEWTGEPVVFEHRQDGGLSYSLRDLTREHLEKILDFYAADYRLLEGYYSVDDVWAAWEGPKRSLKPPIKRVVKTQLNHLKTKLTGGR
jgi:hypothetical protein